LVIIKLQNDMYMNTMCPNCVESEGTDFSSKYPGV